MERTHRIDLKLLRYFLAVAEELQDAPCVHRKGVAVEHIGRAGAQDAAVDGGGAGVSVGTAEHDDVRHVSAGADGQSARAGDGRTDGAGDGGGVGRRGDDTRNGAEIQRPWS